MSHADEEEKSEPEPETVNVKFLRKPDWLVDGSSNKLMMRTCYEPLLKLLLDRIDKKSDTALLGSGGAGKTQLLVLLFDRVAKSGKTVVFDWEGGCAVAKITSGTPTVEFRDRSQGGAVPELSEPGTVYLFDAHYTKIPGDPTQRPVSVFPLSAPAAVTVIAASPSHGVELLTLSSKMEHPNTRVIQRVYLPLWSLPELELLRQNAYSSISADVLVRQFAMFGGTVRNTLTRLKQEGAESVLKQEIDGAIAGCNPALMLQYAHAGQSLDSKLGYITHQLFAIRPSADYLQFSLEFASRYIARGVELNGFTQHYVRCPLL